MSGVVEFERGVVPVEAMRWGSGLSLSLSLSLSLCMRIHVDSQRRCAFHVRLHASASAHVKQTTIICVTIINITFSAIAIITTSGSGAPVFFNVV